MDREVSHPVVRMPFMGDVITHEPGKKIIIKRTVDLFEDLFLAHHLFVNAGTVKPVNACLPVVPLTAGLEMMAECAACLAPGCGLVGFKNVRATQWLRLEDTDTLDLSISACSVAMDLAGAIHRFECRIFVDDSPKAAIQGDVLLAKHYYERLHLDFGPIDGPIKYPFEGRSAYDDGELFHGPLFQCVTGPVAVSGNKVMGELEVLPNSGLFASRPDPELLIDFSLLDGVGQLLGLWCTSCGGEIAFPIGFSQLEIYCPAPAPGTKVAVLAEVKSHGRKILAADVEVQDGAQNVWMRIRGWQEWLFHWSRALYDFRRKPESRLAGRLLKLPEPYKNVVACAISRADAGEMEFDILARHVCHPSEMADLADMEDDHEKWRRLMGIVVAKDAFRRLLADPSGGMPHPAGMVLASSERGRVRLQADKCGCHEAVVRFAASPKGAVAVVDATDSDIDPEVLLAKMDASDADACSDS